jgi:hypothetical protein
VKQELNELDCSGKFSLRLAVFKSNRLLVNNFYSKPYLEEYHNVRSAHQYVFDLASLAFRAKIVVCSISCDSPVLSETIFANKFRRQIRILQGADGSYEALFPLGEIQEKLKHKKQTSDYQFDRFNVYESPDHDDDSEEAQPRRRRSLSDSHYDNFLNDGGILSKRNLNESRDSRNSSTPMDSASQEQEKNAIKSSDHDLKVLMFLDEKNENEDEQAENENEAEPDQEETKESRLHIEKKLDYLFTQEVPMNNLYYEETQSAPLTSTKAHSETMGNFFTPDMGSRR